MRPTSDSFNQRQRLRNAELAAKMNHAREGEPLKAEVRLAKARATIVTVGIYVKGLSARLKSLAQ